MSAPKKTTPPTQRARRPSETAHKQPAAASTNRQYQALAEDQFAPTAGGCKSLLRTVAGRLPTPPTLRSALRTLVRERQGTYAAFLGRIMSGWSVTSAATAIGVSRYQMRDWLSQGLDDTQRDCDTYYARLVSDVHAATACAVGEAEARVAARDPLAYLQAGPGRTFYAREQHWQRPDPSAPPAESDLEPLPLAPALEGEATGPSDDRFSQALDELRRRGLLNSPTTAAAIAAQAQDPAPAVDSQPPVDDRTPPAPR